MRKNSEFAVLHHLQQCTGPSTGTGLDLTRLYLGSEGSLGVITKVCVKVSRQPQVIAGGENGSSTMVAADSASGQV